MRLLSLIFGILFTFQVHAEEILHDKLQTKSGAYQITNFSSLPKAWVLEREFQFSDARAIGLYLNAPPGSKAVFEVTAIGSLSKGEKNRKKHSKRRLRTLSKASSKTWALDFLNQQNKVGKILSIDGSDTETQGISFIFADACAKNSKYLLRVLVDFQTVDKLNQDVINYFTQDPVTLEISYSTPPRSQQSLFKYPSEKNPSEAVVLMRTSGQGSPFLHFTSARNGVPVDIATIPVDNYFYSGLGLFTRVYMGGSYLSGQRASMHHVSTDFTAIYSVCVTMTRKRQELEGYQ